MIIEGEEDLIIGRAKTYLVSPNTFIEGLVPSVPMGVTTMGVSISKAQQYVID